MESAGISKHRKLIVNLLLVVVAVIVGFKIYDSHNKQVRGLEEQISSETKKNEMLNEIIIFERKLRSYKNLLPQRDASEVMRDISELARKSAVKIESLKPTTEVPTPNYTKSPFELVVSAPDYHALGRFISALESAPGVFSVESLSVLQNAQLKILTVNLKVNTITFKE